MTAVAHGGLLSPRAARVITEVLSPVVLIVVVTLVVAIDAAGLRGIGLALITIFFAGVLPYGLVLVGVRRGLLSDHHVSRREQRPKVFAITLGSIGVGLLVLRWLSAPAELFALVAAMIAGVLVALVVSSYWKISIHAASAAGTVACLSLLVSPWWLALAPVVGLSGWARVVLHDHTPAQVWAGIAVGAAVASAVSWLAV